MHADLPTSGRLLTVNEVAAKYRVHRVTVRQWVRKGLIGCVRVGPFGRVRITEAEAARHFEETPGAKS